LVTGFDDFSVALDLLAFWGRASRADSAYRAHLKQSLQKLSSGAPLARSGKTEIYYILWSIG